MTDHRRAILEAFKQFEGGKGWLTRHELKCALTAVAGHKPPSILVDSVIRRAAHLEEGVPFDVFSSCCLEALRDQDPAEHVRQVFKAFDLRSSGFISRNDVYQVFQDAAPAVNKRVVDEVFDELDMDHDGRVGCRDFCVMLSMRHLP